MLNKHWYVDKDKIHVNVYAPGGLKLKTNLPGIGEPIICIA